MTERQVKSKARVAEHSIADIVKAFKLKLEKEPIKGMD